MAWVQTFSGKAVALLDPKPETIDFNDIAHALSQICRFSGHTRTHYSVAQHCCLVADLLPDNLRIYGLLHDAHEAYIGDIGTPIKRALDARNEGSCGLTGIKYDLDCAIYEAAGIPLPSEDTDAAVKLADLVMLMTERRDLLVAPPKSWGESLEAIELDDKTVTPWTTEDAYTEWCFQLCLAQNRITRAKLNGTHNT